MVRSFVGVLMVACLLLGAGGRGLAAEGGKVIAEGEWSKPADDQRGYALRGRLVLCEKPAADGLREVAVYVELQDASEGIGLGMQLFCEMDKRDFRPEHKGGLHCELRDKDGQSVASVGFPFSGVVPKTEWMKLPVDATIRLRASPFGIRREKAMGIAPDLSKLWVIADDDPNEYSLSGTFTIATADEGLEKDGGHIWRGTLELPAVRIRNKGL